MTGLKVLSKKTIAVDVKPGESLLIINKKKKLSETSKITFEGKNIINIALENSKRMNTSYMSLIKVYLTSLSPIRSVKNQCCDVISKYTGMSIEDSELKLKEVLSNLLCPNVEATLKSLPFNLETYEKQRILFAISFLIKPKLIVLDETIFRMDSSIKSYVLDNLKKLREENNTSLIFISNKIDTVNEGVDDIAIMYKGTVLEYGKRSLILKDPIHPYTRYLISCKNNKNFTETSSEISEYVQNINNISVIGCSFCLNCKKASYDCIYMQPKVKTISNERKVICEG